MEKGNEGEKIYDPESNSSTHTFDTFWKLVSVKFTLEILQFFNPNGVCANVDLKHITNIKEEYNYQFANSSKGKKIVDLCLSIPLLSNIGKFDSVIVMIEFQFKKISDYPSRLFRS
jgi:hypothetical protein